MTFVRLCSAQLTNWAGNETRESAIFHITSWFSFSSAASAIASEDFPLKNFTVLELHAAHLSDGIDYQYKIFFSQAIYLLSSVKEDFHYYFGFIWKRTQLASFCLSNLSLARYQWRKNVHFWKDNLEVSFKSQIQIQI